MEGRREEGREEGGECKRGVLILFYSANVRCTLGSGYPNLLEIIWVECPILWCNEVNDAHCVKPAKEDKFPEHADLLRGLVVVVLDVCELLEHSRDHEITHTDVPECVNGDQRGSRKMSGIWSNGVWRNLPGEVELTPQPGHSPQVVRFVPESSYRHLHHPPRRRFCF